MSDVSDGVPFSPVGDASDGGPFSPVSDAGDEGTSHPQVMLVMGGHFHLHLGFTGSCCPRTGSSDLKELGKVSLQTKVQSWEGTGFSVTLPRLLHKSVVRCKIT